MAKSFSLVSFRPPDSAGSPEAGRLPYSDDHTTISSDCKTIHVRKSIWNGREQKPKTRNAIRSVDIPEALAAFLKSFAGDRTSGFLFQTDSGLPLGQSNVTITKLGMILGVEHPYVVPKGHDMNLFDVIE